MRVAVNTFLIGLVRGPVDESGMVLRKQHRPFAHGQAPGAFFEVALWIGVELMLRLAVDVSASIHRIGEDMVNRCVGGGDPADLAMYALS